MHLRKAVNKAVDFQSTEILNASSLWSNIWEMHNKGKPNWKVNNLKLTKGNSSANATGHGNHFTGAANVKDRSRFAKSFP